MRSATSARRIAFAPAVSLPVQTNERIPKMFLALSDCFEVIPIPLSKFNKSVYDQHVNKLARYLLFLIDEFITFKNCLVLSKRHGASLIFAENAYVSLAGGLSARILHLPLVWDNHGNIKIFAESLGKSRFFTSANVILERLLERLATSIFVVSRVDRDGYEELGFDMEKFKVIPICADTKAVDRNLLEKREARRKLSIPEDQKVVLFFGTLTYYPNLEAARYIVRELSPAVKKELDNVHIYIAGGGSYPDPLPDNVHHLGFVPFDPDLCIWLSVADICIAPLWKGVGVLTKVIDMLSAKKPTVLTPLCLKGIPELAHGENCLVGEDRERFSGEVVRLLSDVELQKRIGTNGRHLIDESYSWDVVGKRVCDILDSIMDTGGD